MTEINYITTSEGIKLAFAVSQGSPNQELGIVFLGGFSPFAVDEKTELVLVIFQPLFSIIMTFGSRTVFHFFVESLQIHVSPHRLTVCRRVTAGNKMFELPFNIGQ